jgi:hypothetical protein
LLLLLLLLGTSGFLAALGLAAGGFLSRSAFRAAAFARAFFFDDLLDCVLFQGAFFAGVFCGGEAEASEVDDTLLMAKTNHSQRCNAAHPR